MKDKDMGRDGKVGEAMKRDTDQTKHDVTRGRKGEDLNQNVSDTVKQSTGREPIPPRHMPNAEKK